MTAQSRWLRAQGDRPGWRWDLVWIGCVVAVALVVDGLVPGHVLEVTFVVGAVGVVVDRWIWPRYVRRRQREERAQLGA